MWALVLGGFCDVRVRRPASATANRRHDCRRRRCGARRPPATSCRRRLQAMQARVEPQFLFDTLDRIGEIYDRDPAKGQRTIDDLIAYLRTAMPQMNSSTLHARARNRTRAHLRGDRRRMQRRPRAARHRGHRRLVPGRVSADAAVAAGRARDRQRPPDAAGGRRNHAARRQAPTASCRSRSDTAATPSPSDDTSDAVGRVREHLQTLFDAEARLDLRKRADHGTEIVMEIPG